MFFFKRTLSLTFLFLILLCSSCKKNDFTITTPAVAEFASQNSSNTGSYYISNSSNSVFMVPIGISTVSATNRVINFTVSSPTGATSGTQYTIASTSITIPAGKVVDSIPVKGIFSGYPTGRRDTLVFTITGGDVAVFDAFKSYKLVMQKYCDVVGSNLIGSYTQSTDLYNGTASTKPKYTATISNFTAINATSATVIIKNLGATSDNGWGPFASTDPVSNPGLTATLDWSNPSSFTVNIPTQNYFNDGTGMSTIKASGTFSSCDNNFNIICSVKYAGNGNTYTHTSVLNR